MMPLQVAGDAALTWEQVDRRGKRFELRAGATVIATLDLPKVWRSTANARAATGAWEFQRVGFFRPHLRLRGEGAPEDTATFIGTGHGKSQVTFRDGRVFAWHPARGRDKQWTFRDETGHDAISYIDANQGAGAYHFTMQIAAALREEPAGILLATLGMYLIVEAVTAAMIAATTGA